MSMRYYSDYGYGIKFSDIENVISRKRFVEFLHLDKDSLADLEESVDGEDGDFLDGLREFYAGYNGYYASVFVEYISAKYGIYLNALTDEDDEIYLVYIPPFPWGLTEVEKTLTKERLGEIITETLYLVVDDNVVSSASNLMHLLDYHDIINYG